MLRKQWQEYALKAKQIAKHIVTGLEQDKNGVRLIQIVYGLDMYATDALNLKYSKQRSNQVFILIKGEYKKYLRNTQMEAKDYLSLMVNVSQQITLWI